MMQSKTRTPIWKEVMHGRNPSRNCRYIYRLELWVSAVGTSGDKEHAGCSVSAFSFQNNFIISCPTPRFVVCCETTWLRTGNGKITNPPILASQVHQVMVRSSLTAGTDYQKAYKRVNAKTRIHEEE